MELCDECMETIRTEHGEINVSMCKMLGNCTCVNKIAQLHKQSIKHEVEQ